MGEKQRNEHDDKKADGRDVVGKGPVLGMRERGGKVVAMPIKMADKATIQNIIFKHVEEDTTICIGAMTGRIWKATSTIP